MDFSQALAAVKAGQRVQRPHMHDEWVNKDWREQLTPPNAEHPGGVWSEPKQVTVIVTSWVHLVDGALMLHTVDGREIPYHAEPQDLLADDWRECAKETA